MIRVCIDCPKALGRANKSGRCRSCCARAINRDPVLTEKRQAGLRAKFQDEAFLTEHRERLNRMGKLPHVVAIRRELGKAIYQERLGTPEARAYNASPAVRARAAASSEETLLGWCPIDRRQEYRELIRCKGLTAAEARAVIEEEVDGTKRHAERVIANHDLNMRLRHERRLREAY